VSRPKVWKIPTGWHETVCTTIAATIALIVILLFAQDLEVQDEEEEEEEEHEHEYEEATTNRDWNSFGDARDSRRAESLLHYSVVAINGGPLPTDAFYS
jgi:hypothetical protein